MATSKTFLRLIQMQLQLLKFLISKVSFLIQLIVFINYCKQRGNNTINWGPCKIHGRTTILLHIFVLRSVYIKFCNPTFIYRCLPLELTQHLFKTNSNDKVFSNNKQGFKKLLLIIYLWARHFNFLIFPDSFIFYTLLHDCSNFTFLFVKLWFCLMQCMKKHVPTLFLTSNIFVM